MAKKNKKKGSWYNRAGVERVMGFCKVPYKPLPHRDVTLPKRQPRGGYREPDLPSQRIPVPF